MDSKLLDGKTAGGRRVGDSKSARGSRKMHMQGRLVYNNAGLVPRGETPMYVELAATAPASS